MNFEKGSQDRSKPRRLLKRSHNRAALTASLLAAAISVSSPARSEEFQGKGDNIQSQDESEREKTFNLLIKQDPDKFMERARELGRKTPFISLLHLAGRKPLLLLNNLDVFKLEAHSEQTLVFAALEKCDVVEAADWLSGNQFRLARLKADAERWARDFKFDFQKKEYQIVENFPSPDAARLMMAFYIKHGGKAVRWTETVDHIGEFETAARLLKKYPLLAERARRADPRIDGSTFKKVAGSLLNIENILIKTNNTDEFLVELRKQSKEIAERTMGWANQFDAPNPLLLAKYAVLVARDMALRNVASDTADEVLKSIERVEAGQREARNIDILKERDLAVYISGDSDVESVIQSEKKTGIEGYFGIKPISVITQRVPQTHDRNSVDLIRRIWREKNPKGYMSATIAVPFDQEGKVTESDIEQTKRKLLEYIASGGNARTILIEAHGGKESIGLYKDPAIDSQESGARFITPGEFAAAHKKRLSDPEVRKSYAAGKRDVYLFTQCFSFNFARKVFELLKKDGIPLPIIIASAEEGASSLFVPPSAKPGGEAYFTSALAKRLSGGLGTIVDQALTFTPDGIDSPIIIFLPDAEGRPLQVTDAVGPQDSNAA